MKNKISPKKKPKLLKQGVKDPIETANSKQDSDSEYNLYFTLNQLLHMHQNLPIYQYTQEK